MPVGRAKMKTRTRNALALAFLAATTITAIAAWPKVERAKPHALDAIPDGAILLASVDLNALRHSQLGPLLLREGREIPGVAKVRDLCGFDVLETLRDVTLAIPRAGDAGEFGLSAAGPLDPDTLIVCASKLITARGGRPAVDSAGSFRTVRDATLAAGSGEIAVRRGGPLLLGEGTYLRAMIDAADGRAPSIRASTAHADLTRQVTTREARRDSIHEGDEVFRVTVVLSAEQRRTLAEELERGGATQSATASIVAAALAVRMGPVVTVDGVLACDTAAACATIAATLDRTRAGHAGDLGARLLGTSSMLERLKITAQGEWVHARAAVPAEQLAPFVSRLLAFQGLLRSTAPSQATPAKQQRKEGMTMPPPDEVLRPESRGTRGTSNQVQHP